MTTAGNDKQRDPSMPVRLALEAFRSALQKSVREKLPGSVIRGVDLVSQYGIDLKLAWKTVRILNSSDPFESVRYLPGPAGVRILCEALKSVGTSSASVDVVQAAYENVKRVGTTWAGDSRGFELMAAGLAKQRDPQMDQEHRKAHFFSGSYIWGIRAKSMLRIDILNPARDGRNAEAFTARGYFDVERLRTDAPWYVEIPYCKDDNATHQMRADYEPIDPAGTVSNAAYLWRRFCSAGMPVMKPPAIQREIQVVELPVGAVGVECRFSLVHGVIFRGELPIRRTADNAVAWLMLKVQTPCERAVHDIWIHRDLIDIGWKPSGAMYCVIDGWRGNYSAQNRDKLPFEYEVRELATGKRGSKVEGIPAAEEMVDAAFERTGWNRKNFAHFRVEAIYPPFPCAMTFRVDLPE